MTVHARWKKSSRSQNTTNCIEVAHAGLVRDSKNPAGPMLRVDVSRMVFAVKVGKLNR